MLLRGDCFEVMEGLQDETFDVVLTDPPYGMGADEFGDSGGKVEAEHGYADSAGCVMGLIARLPQRLFDLTKPQAHAYIFCDIAWFKDWSDAMQRAGFRVFRTPLIWHKPGGFRAPWPEHGPQRKYEVCLFAVKGDMKVTKILGDVLTHGPDTNVGHNAQKPVALLEDLLKRSIQPGMRVLDPFCGSGSIFPAAQACKVFATGIEMDETYYGVAAKRLQDLKGKV